MADLPVTVPHSKELVPSPRIPIPRSNFGAGHKKLRCHQAAAARGGPAARPFRVAAGPGRTGGLPPQLKVKCFFLKLLMVTDGGTFNIRERRNRI